jgi:hypothetical protein
MLATSIHVRTVTLPHHIEDDTEKALTTPHWKEKACNWAFSIFFGTYRMEFTSPMVSMWGYNL